MVYIESMTDTDRLTENIRVRISKKMKSHLQLLADQRGPGTKLSDLAREAIHQTYFATYPLAEVRGMRAAESPKKSKER